MKHTHTRNKNWSKLNNNYYNIIVSTDDFHISGSNPQQQTRLNSLNHVLQ